MLQGLRTFFALAFAVAGSACLAQDEGLLVPYSYFGLPCMKNAEFAFGPVAMDDPTAQVHEVLGDPASLLSHQDMPELSFPIDTWRYDGLDVFVFDNKVVEMTATQPRWQTPSGLAVGMTRTALVDAFGMEPATPQSDVAPGPAYVIPFCNGFVADELGWEMRVFIDDAQIVEQISFLRGWP